tara:strand:- start:449 stop:826 length:378 start_codon:yes stop_codon:yes gene_type:complete
MKRNKLKNIIKKILKEQTRRIDPNPRPFLDPKVPTNPDYNPPSGPNITLPELDPDRDKGDYPGVITANVGIWKIISVTPNYSGNPPQQKYSALCPESTTDSSNTLYPNKNKAKSVQINKRPKKRK